MKKEQVWQVSKYILLSLALLLVLLIAIQGALAQARYDLSWWTVDTGGGSSSADNYVVSGTIGQADAIEPIHGGNFTLSGGFWPIERDSSGEEGYKNYLPLVVRGQ